MHWMIWMFPGIVGGFLALTGGMLMRKASEEEALCIIVGVLTLERGKGRFMGADLRSAPLERFIH